jgi:hypothetical protein
LRNLLVRFSNWQNWPKFVKKPGFGIDPHAAALLKRRRGWWGKK